VKKEQGLTAGANNRSPGARVPRRIWQSETSRRHEPGRAGCIDVGTRRQVDKHDAEKALELIGFGTVKVGLTEGDAVDRIAAQISTGTPDKPVLLVEIRTHDCGPLEKAIHATLEYRGKRVCGGGKEWFKTTRDEIVSIYESVAQKTTGF
jgi:T5orf172 domain